MNKVIEYFRKLDNEPLLVKQIKVYGWKKSYNYKLVQSITPYLFEDLKIKNHLAKQENENRPGDKKQKVYITIHDTGDTDPARNAKFWSDAVYNQELKDTKDSYKCSFQYVVGNDGIYHNIPDDEVAWHAGDSTKVDFREIPTGLIYDESMTGELTINKQFYYCIDGKATLVKAPMGEKIVDGKTVKFPPHTSNINDQGIYISVNEDNEIVIGETYFNTGYEKIANRGGNNNSIGIEIVVAKGQNIYYNMQLAAKLVAQLLIDNNLGILDIKQHHFFSGKNCPQTIRMNGLWEHFLSLVEIDLQVREFINEGYKINLIIDSNIVNPNGTIDKLPACMKGIKYTIQTEFNGEVEQYLFVKLI